ncbi:HesA/MoeB/ThiF family protein [Actinoplanes subtropicus]|uniref:HesA/MoeB/ThiF family protein n=1 Tax=Actinoplanes subtropicus TaxID=543632 RepID=UPI002480E403|nr:ThiF family adenylyltransferase [Actinoplanes subtropicus]
MGETPEHLALVIVLPRPVGVEYPETIDDLLRTLDAQRLSRTYAQDLLDEIIEINAERGREAGTTPPITVLLASPSTRADAPHRIAHLAAWRADTDATVRWERVFDQRGQITVRRDQDRPAGWLLGRRLLILGCGALGAPAAELCLRAGAAELHLVDNGLVHPGILVRQPYDERDIGRRKAAALAEGLRAIRPDARITAYAEDARDVLTGCRDWHGVDLIIDATANRTVATCSNLSGAILRTTGQRSSPWLWVIGPSAAFPPYRCPRRAAGAPTCCAGSPCSVATPASPTSAATSSRTHPVRTGSSPSTDARHRRSAGLPPT